MATRFYFPASGNVAYADPNGVTDWDVFSSTFQQCGPLITSKLTTSLTIAGGAEVSASPQSILMWRAVSLPLDAQTISGNVKGQVRCFEPNVAADMFVKVVIRLVNPDMTHKAYIYDGGSPASGTEMATTPTNRRMFPGGSVAITSQVAAAGDHIVVEIGAYANNVVTTSYAPSMYINDSSGTDQPEDEAATTAARDTWIEFDDTITFSSTQMHAEAVEYFHEEIVLAPAPNAGQVWPRGAGWP